MKLMTKYALAVLLVFMSITSVMAEERIKCSSTTSTQNSGFFDYLLPIFEAKSGIKVDVIAAGTGAAIEQGKRGDVDFVFVHAKEDELKAVEAGFFTDRHDVMYNDFIIVGPAADPAGIKKSASASDAMKKISECKDVCLFISRGDDSGTHKKELKLWKNAGIDPKGMKFYLEAGQGMEKVQRIASEKKAYTLTDRGTWLAVKDKDKLELVALYENDPSLFNQYGVMAVSKAKNPSVKYDQSMKFINWIISKEGQEAVAGFKDKNGVVLFKPNAEKIAGK